MIGFFSLDLLVTIVIAFLCSVGFAVVLRVAPRHVITGSIGGAATYFIYCAVMYAGLGYFAAGFISTTFTALYAEILARVRRAPAIVFLLPGVIPTVPGGDLYRGMRDLISGKMPEALANFGIALNIALGIAGGIVVISITFGIITDMKNKIRLKRQR
jgi:uncharacterized membrane protein YjjB (DUF3815 family)